MKNLYHTRKTKRNGFMYSRSQRYFMIWLAFAFVIGAVHQGQLTETRLLSEQRHVVSPIAQPEKPIHIVLTPTATPTPSELSEVVAYIAEAFEPEGKEVVIRAINCFYSESGLRKNAVGVNSDVHKSKDHGIAQLNDYWHKLTEKEKTDIKANIDKAYKIYKGRGNNFSAWYGKLCN